MPKRSNKDLEGRQPLTLSVTQQEKQLIEEEAANSRQTVSAYVLRAINALASAPRFGDVPMLPSAGFCVLPVGVDEHIFVPRNWTPDHLRRAAKFYEGLADATSVLGDRGGDE
jgi:hypothetical protein